MLMTVINQVCNLVVRFCVQVSNLPNNWATRCNLCKRCPWRKPAISPDYCPHRRGQSRWNLDPV